MGPKAKMTEDKKIEMFETWKKSAEYEHILKFQGKRAEIIRIELSWKDLCFDLQPYLDAQYEFIRGIKVPGCKAKCKSYFKCTIYLF